MKNNKQHNTVIKSDNGNRCGFNVLKHAALAHLREIQEGV